MASHAAALSEIDDRGILESLFREADSRAVGWVQPSDTALIALTAAAATRPASPRRRSAPGIGRVGRIGLPSLVRGRSHRRGREGVGVKLGGSGLPPVPS